MTTRIKKRGGWYVPQYLGKFLCFNVWYDYTGYVVESYYDSVDHMSIAFETEQDAELFLEKYGNRKIKNAR
jgi:hypothetical protein